MSYLEGIGDEVLFTIIIATILAFIILFISISSSTPEPTDDPNNSSLLTRPQVNEILEETLPESTRIEEPEPDNLSDVAESTSSTEPKNSLLEPISELEPPTTIKNPIEEQDEENDVLETAEAIRTRRLGFFENEIIPESTNNSTQKKASGIKTTSPAEENGQSTSDVNGSINLNGNVQSTTMTEDVNQNVDENSIDPSEETVEGSFSFRIKFLDDREKIVTGRPAELVGDFKKRYFATELSNNKMVRLITNGQVLQDSLSLSFYNLSSGCVVHAQISNLNTSARMVINQTDQELDLGQFLWPLLGVLLGVLWMLHYYYRDFFNASSTVALLGLSGLFLTVIWTQYSRPQQAATGQGQAATGQNL